MNSDVAIQVQNISKTFRIEHEQKNSIYDHIFSMFKKSNSETLQVLKNISFSINKGDVIGIIGLNGCGKSTLLKILSKIYSQDSGTVFINGKMTSFLELSVGFNGEFTAKDNVIIYGMLLGFSKKQILSKIDSIIQFAELEKFLDTKLKNFSLGMQARLGFSTAIHAEPDIMLIDEALSVGDLPFQQKCFKVFEEFKKQKKTLVFVSHSLDQISAICNKVIWIKDGKIQSYDEPSIVLEEYRKSVQ